MSGTGIHGKFLWHEVVTPDTGAAARFYAAVLGFKAQPFDADPGYTVLAAPAGVVGGVRALGPGAGAAHWLGYVGVTDLDAAVLHAERLRGRVVRAVAHIPGGSGRHAVIADPYGGTLGLYQPSASQHGDGTPMDASPALGWYELGASDGEAAVDFYRELLGWELPAVHDMGPMGEYRILGLAGKQFGGVFSSREKQGWMLYFNVPGAAEAVTAVKAAGGALVREPTQVPGGGWIAQFTDPQGAVFAVLSAERSAKPAAPKAQAAPKPAAPKPAAPKPAASVAKAAPKPAAPEAKAAPKAVQAKSKAVAKRSPARARPKSGTARSAARTKARPKVKASRAKSKAKRAVKRGAKRAAKRAVRRVARKGARRPKRPARKK